MALILRFIAALALFVATSSAFAQVVINAAAVAAGGITPGDTAGYPATISVSGSYKLTSNLTPPGAIGIDITANNVTIDLNGFTIDGGGSCPITGGFGNTCTPLGSPNALIRTSATGVTIQNGIVRGNTKGHGIWFTNTGPNALNAKVINVLVSDNANDGVLSVGSGPGFLLVNSQLTQNGGMGAHTNHGLIVTGSQFTGNNTAGLGGGSATVSDSMALQNNAVGFGGQQLNLEHVSSGINQGDGVNVTYSGIVSHTMTWQNYGNGITISPIAWGGLVVDSTANYIAAGKWGFSLNTNGCYQRIEAAKPYAQAISGGSYIQPGNDPCAIFP